MNFEQRIQSFKILSVFIQNFLNNQDDSKKEMDQFNKTINEAFLYNGWFTRNNSLKSLKGICNLIDTLNHSRLKEHFIEPERPKTIAVIMAGNIPAVGFHDLMCVLLSGHRILIKLSSDDKIIIPFLMSVLVDINPEFKNYIAYSQNKLTGFDAVIATGSNNSSAYFEYYFGKYPHIIRKNRNSLAILNGNETSEELELLGNDIFDYYGLGCRNVSKIFVPAGYSFNQFFESIYSFAHVIENKKYANNYEYNRAIYLMTQEKFLDNNFLLVKHEKEQLSSPIGVVFFDEYQNEKELEQVLNSIESKTQCIASNFSIENTNTVKFSETQSPDFFDYADGIDVMKFINNL
jgi:hypothetical protein